MNNFLGDVRIGKDLVVVGTLDMQGSQIRNIPNPADENQPIPLGYLPVIFGNNLEGDALFCNEDGSQDYSGDRVLKVARVVDNDTDLANEKALIDGFGTIFNTWQRFSHLNNDGFPALPAELNGWQYVSSTDSILSTINSVSYIGFVSPERYTKYSLEVNFKSTNGDDDSIGIVLAYTVQNGKQYTLSALRSLGGEGSTWILIYNKSQTNAKIIVNKSNTIKWGNGGSGMTAVEAGYITNTAGLGWNTFPSGTNVKITRDGDQFTLITTELNSSVYVPASEITFNLNDYPELLKFKGACSVGYSCASQASSTFKNISFSGDQNIIYDIRDNSVWVWNGSSWVLSDKKMGDYISQGRLLSNQRTKQLFFMQYKDKALRIV